jgi:hypothetical protein
MKLVFFTMMLAFISGTAIAEEASSDVCPQTSEYYQQQYHRTKQTSNMDCYLKAFEREMSGKQKLNCPLSAERYRTRFEQSGSSNDLACYEQALTRESE